MNKHSLNYCYDLMDAGYSLLTVGENKVPNYKWASTKSLKNAPLTKEKFKKQYDYEGGYFFDDGKTEFPATKGVGIATGYKDLEVVDVDTKILDTEEEKEKFWKEYLSLLEDNIEDFHYKVAIYRTRSGGFHIIYRAKNLEGNLKLAKPKGHKEALIETRGIGGYVFIYSDQVSNLSYFDVKEISEEDRNSIVECSKYYNYIEPSPEKLPSKVNDDFKEQSLKTWEDYNNRNSVFDLISDQFTECGKASGNILVLRNGAKSKHSGYIFKDTDKLFLYSTGTEYPHEQPLGAFDIYRIRNHNGDYKKTCSDLYKQGYGSRLVVAEYKKEEFWYYTKKGGVMLDNFKFKQFLEGRKIFKYYPLKSDNGYVFIQKDGNFIDITYESKIKDFVLNHLYNVSQIDVWNMMTSKVNYFSKDFLSMLNSAEIDVSKDGRDYGMIYYNNKAVKITKNSFRLIDYDNVNGYVWKKQVINRDIDLKPESDGVYKSFVWKISGENKEKYYTFKSVIGYLLHSYKDKSKNKAIIFNDEVISDNPNGGSGKGIFHSAISMLKNMSTIDGKMFDNSKSFLYQTVDPDSQVLLFDDVKKGFDFESLFSVITEGITIEKKGKDAVLIPFEDSPKISITTNYTIKGEGGSHKRRKFDVEMSSFFNENHTPEDEFNQSLFDDWDAEEWAKFDNYMLRCLQYYLKNGIVKSDYLNLEVRKLIDSTNNLFVDFMNAISFEGERHYKTDFYDKFVKEYQDFATARWFTRQLLSKWIKLYADHKKLQYTDGQSNGQRYFVLGDEKKELDLLTQEEPF